MMGVLKKFLPERVNEIIGLQHMKFFIFDDSIIISGYIFCFRGLLLLLMMSGRRGAF